ncbi:MAG: YHS domain-containing (seleno)protein [Saprospiraceae bacterium]
MKIIPVLLFSILVSTTVFAQQAIRVKQFNLNKGIAIQGYDPVAYFTQHKAVEGSKNIIEIVEGITYWFSSVANKDLFLKDYKKYEPQFGGWCAYAMGYSGKKVEVDPETFKIVDGKLYLFYHTRANNTLTTWNNDENNLKAKADKNWQKIIQ